MQLWILVGVLGLAELLVLARIPAALISGAVPLNPLSWIGYGELGEASVERTSAPGIYWLILAVMTTAAVLFGCFIYVILFRGAA